MAITPSKAKPPQYPRPVPFLEAIEIPICPGTVVYEQWTDDAEREAAKRAEKRQKRVRDNAEAYMRGENLYIMTAKLRGPFNGKWKNPWISNKSIINVENEIPETAVRRTGPVVITKAALTHQPECIDLTNDDIEFTQPAIIQQRGPVNVFAQTKRKEQHNNLTPRSAKRVEDWLKTNTTYDAIPTSSGVEMRSSPTPASRDNRLPSPDQTSRRPVSAGGAKHDTQVGEWATKFAHADLSSSQQTHESQHRAEAAILENHRRSVHKIPPSTNLPGFKYRWPKRQFDKVRETTMNDSSTTEPRSELTRGELLAEKHADEEVIAQAPASTQGKGARKPILSKETSKTTDYADVPEAQAVPVVKLVESTSNAQETAELLQPVEPVLVESNKTPVIITDSTKSVQDNSTEEKAAQTAKAGNLHEEVSPTANTDGVEHSLEQSTTHQTPFRNLETQALLGSVQPFAISTIKKLPLKQATDATPVPTTKRRVTRKTKKRASFAGDPTSDESQSSIKAGFHVRKPATVPTPLISKPVTSLDDDTFLDEEIYDLNPPTLNHTKHVLPKPALKAKPPVPKSILKPHPQPTSTAPASAPPGTTVTATGLSTYQSNASSSMKQDAQQPRATDMFAIENGTDSQQLASLKGFDIDAVVDDLGSYLGTWDVEREVERVA